jgi:membrane-associated PAP2 superfamily phosphatase
MVTRDVTKRRFWLLHLAMPAAAFALLFIPWSFTDWDASIASSWAYDPARGWIGQGTFWAETLLHEGGRHFVRAIAGGCLLIALLPVRRTEARRIAGYVFLAVTASALLAGMLKQTTNVDCPWDLVGFGGTRPSVQLFATRPDGLPSAACFPGAHSASGFALLAFYFAFRDSSLRLARLGLALGLLTGTAFAVAQGARGAHFLSHDLASAFLSWCTCVVLYVAWRAAAPRRTALS